jgi:hypothetical protein
VLSAGPDYKARKRYKPNYCPELLLNSNTVLVYTDESQIIASQAFCDFPLVLDYYNILEYDSKVMGVCICSYMYFIK